MNPSVICVVAKCVAVGVVLVLNATKNKEGQYATSN